MTEENEEILSSDENQNQRAILEGKKDENFEYPEDYKEKFIQDVDLPNSLTKTYEIIGLDMSKRYNYYFLNENEILMAVANTFQIFNISTKERKIFFSTEIGGIGCVTSHPSKKFFAVGECGSFPNIYIFRYEEGKSKLYRILRKGTEQVYSALSFNDKGDLLASVGGEPDYNLVIWNWKTEAIILKAKAFSQEVYRVQFSNLFEEKSITSGMGHIKFWEMATTFTGLKLQGELGKFGQVDLSDISAFVEFPDGKVLSGTEHGTFLLWEGIFIKANLDEGEGKKIHEDGLVEHMSWIKAENPEDVEIMSAGHDGKIKWWRYLDIENVMLDDYSNGVIQPKKTVQLINPVNNKPIKIMNLVKTDNFWLIQDGNGFLVKVSPNDNFACEVLFEGHAGPILNCSFEPKVPLLVSLGKDEKVGLTTYCSNMKQFPEKLILEEPFTHKGIYPTCSDIPKRDMNENPYIIAIGYSNGMFKVFYLNPSNKKIELIFQARPHKEAIKFVKFSPDKGYFLTATKEEIFFFDVEKFDKITPRCCIQPEEKKIVDIDWNPDSHRILVGYNNGILEEIEVPLYYENNATYILKEYKKREMKIKKAETEIEKIDEKKRQRQKEQGKLKEDPAPGTVYSCKYIDLRKDEVGDFIVTSQKPYNEQIYLCNLDFLETNPDHRPRFFWKLPPDGEYYIKHISANYIFLAEHKGALQIRNKKFPDKYVEIQPNLPGVGITSVASSDDEKFVSVCYSDGLNQVYGLDTDGFNMHISIYSEGNFSNEKVEELQSRTFPDIELEKNTIDQCLDVLKKGEAQSFNVITQEEVNIEELLSLEDAKQDALEKERERLANEKKEKLFKKVNKLRDDFNKLVARNNELPEEVRLTPDEIILDNKYLEIVNDELKAGLEDVEAKYNWLKANIEISIQKINSFFLSSVHTGKTTVFAFRTDDKVKTIRCPNLPNKFEENLKKYETSISEFAKKTDFGSLTEKYQELLGSNTIDQEKELQKIEALIELGSERVESQKERMKGNQAIIEPEIEATKGDLVKIEEYLNTKKIVSGKQSRGKKYVDFESPLFLKLKSKKGKAIEKIDLVRCPDEYNLKLNCDNGEKLYNEKNMLTLSRHYRRIYKFLKMLYDEREKFNKRVMDLKDAKLVIINKLSDYRKEIEEYDKILGIEEDLDWYHFKNLDFTEDLLAIPEEKLQEYMKSQIEKDKTLKQIYSEEAEQKENEEDQEEEWKFEVKERHNKIVNTNVVMQNEKKNLDELKYNYLKAQKLKEINKEIDDFDAKVERLKNERIQISLCQKIGEYELLIKQKELNKLRAYENEDKVLSGGLFKLFEQYEVNISNLASNRDILRNIEDEKEQHLKRIKEYDDEFHKLIENEGANKETYEKHYISLSRDNQKDGNDEDKIEEEINLPKSLANKSLLEEIKSKADARKLACTEIEKLDHRIKDNENKRAVEIENKRRHDDTKARLIDKINNNETHKLKYMNQIELALPIWISNFNRIQPMSGKTPIRLDDSVIINKNKIIQLETYVSDINEQNATFKKDNDQFGFEKSKIINEQKNLTKSGDEVDTEFKNEQILKFGLEIEFDKLLQASKKTTVDKFENEYRKLKIESNRQIEQVKNRIDRAKKDLNSETVTNTEQLKIIKDLLKKKQDNDQKLEAKNSEITKKNSKKYEMVDLKNKKKKLKEIMKLLKQQMEALKKEIDIFKRKGGHIYSTIASNLV